MRRLSAILLAVGVGTAPRAVTGREPLVDIRSVDPSIRVDLRYHRADNTFHRVLYPGSTALLRRPVARRLARVQAHLRARHLSLVVWDAYRPTSVQWAMWRIRPNRQYLVPPWLGSKHSRGAAVDVTLATEQGSELPMPTPHDEFSSRAHRGAVLGVTPTRRRNAAVLNKVMQADGFRSIPNEWWHFDAPDAARYPLADVSIP